jgi:peptidoglycan/LPS O-acetylase OafA/YrhL
MAERAVPALDGARGVAILLVMVHNLSPFDPYTEGPGYLVALLLNPGWIGVQLFFVLSGYLITGILLDAQGQPHAYRTFMARRVLRIFPLYYATLAAFFVVLPLLGVAPAILEGDRAHQVFLWTYVVNWTMPYDTYNSVFPHFWSLGVEEQFYLLWPLVALRLSPRGLMKLAAWLFVASFASRVVLRMMDTSYDAPYSFTICRMDALSLGGALAALMRWPGGPERIVRLRKKLLWACGALLLAGLFITRGWPRNSAVSQTIGYTVLALAFVALVAAAVGDHLAGRGVAGRVLGHPVLRGFGRYSYGIYIFHPLLATFVGLPLLRRLAPTPPSVLVGIGYVLAATAASYGVGFLSYHLFERHFLALKRYFSAAPAPAPR